MAGDDMQGVVWGRELSGHQSVTRLQLQRAMGAYLRAGRWKNIKVGIASNPEQRWKNAYRDHGWQTLVVVYRSNSWESVQEVEDFLILYACADFIRPSDDDRTIPERHTQADAFILNERRGRAGRPPKAGPPYFVYFALAPRYARITKK